MAVVPLSKPAKDSQLAPNADGPSPIPWARIAAAGTLLAGSVLLLNGKRRAGMLAAASGTALALLDQQETLSVWWDSLPCYLDEVQRLLSYAQNTVDEFAGQSERLHNILQR